MIGQPVRITGFRDPGILPGATAAGVVVFALERIGIEEGEPGL